MKKEFDIIYAEKLYDSGKFKKYFRYCYQAALNDDADAQYKLAVCYEQGIGIGVDPIEAEGWFTMAGKNGGVLANAEVGSASDDTDSETQEEKKELTVDDLLEKFNARSTSPSDSSKSVYDIPEEDDSGCLIMSDEDWYWEVNYLDAPESFDYIVRSKRDMRRLLRLDKDREKNEKKIAKQYSKKHLADCIFRRRRK